MTTVSKFFAVLRIATATVVISSFVSATAQTANDSKEALAAAGTKEFEAAALLLKNTDRESREAALEKLNKSLDLFVRAGSSVGQAGTLMMRGYCLDLLGRLDEALADEQKALVLFEQANLLNSQAMVLNFIGAIYLKKKDAAKARDTLERSWELFQKSPIEGVDVTILTNLANAYIDLNDRKKATDALWKAFQLAKDRNPEVVITTLNNYADAQVRLGTPKYAEFYYESALKRAREAKLDALEANLLNSLSSLYLNHLESLPKAKPYLDQALAKLETVNDESLKCTVLYNYGFYSYLSIRMQDALEYYERARVIAVKLKSRAHQANIANNTGLVYLFFDDFKKALPYFDDSIAIARELNNPALEAYALVNHGKAQEGTGDAKTAVADIQRALELAKAGFPGSGKFATKLLFDLGTIAFRAGDRKQALTIYQEALPKARAWGISSLESSLLNNIAKIHEIDGDIPKALEMYNTALGMVRSAGVRYGEARALENLMSVWAKLGNRNLAAFYGKNAINIYQEFRKGMTGLSAEDQQNFLRDVEAGYRKLAEVLIQQGRIAEAEQVLVMLKQEELIDYVRRDDRIASGMLATMALTDDERAALTRYGTVADQLTGLGKEFSDLDLERKAYAVGEFPKQKRYDELKQQLADATLVFEKFLEELKLKFGQQDLRVAQVDSSLKRTLERLKAHRAAIVSTIVGEDALSIIVTTSRTQRAHTVKIAAKDINELVAKFRMALTSPNYDPRPSGQKFYDLIVKPIEGDLAGIKADTIVWSLDGTLRYIPPAAIWDKKNGYLAERFSNVIINLASRDTLSLPVASGQKLSVLGVGVSKAVESFSALAAVPDELDCIVSDKAAGTLSATPQCAKGVLEGRKLLDETFTLANFEGELGRYPIIHIASHFKLTPGDDKNSFLLLGGGGDRKYTVEKLRGEPLTDVELIVLSACNTATPGGAKANGVEIEGFGSIAQKEGAKSVMATLWSVADSSTKDFMVEFYRLYGNEGKSKAAAMRDSQLKLMYGKYAPKEGAKRQRADEFTAMTDDSLPKFVPDPNAPYAHPYYWSPFILIGNWR
jgi:CHAT domain-containing protein/tetratricopeptide (TPR) repeat protein